MTPSPDTTRNRPGTRTAASERRPDHQRTASGPGPGCDQHLHADVAVRGAARETISSSSTPSRKPGQRTDHDRLAGLLCGLMHYAERRRLSFADALAARAGTTTASAPATCPGRGRVQVQRTTTTDSAPLTGEITRARPGRPPFYLVDFITSREWLAEPDLAPAEPFPATATHYGEISSAHVARDLLARTIRRIEIARENGNDPDTRDAQDLGTLLTTLCQWSGLERPTVLSLFSEVLTEKDGHLLIAGPPRTHPVALAATGIPTRPPRACGEMPCPPRKPRPPPPGQQHVARAGTAGHERRADARRAETDPATECGRYLCAIGRHAPTSPRPPAGTLSPSRTGITSPASCAG